MSVQQVEIDLTIGGAEALRVVQFRVEEAVSEITHAVVEIAVMEDLDLTSSLGERATLLITTADGSSRRWTLVLGSVEFLRAEGGSLRFSLHLYAAPWLLGHTLDTRKHRGLSAKEIVAKTLGEHGIAHAFRITREPRAREYCVQYHESDLDFASRLLEFEGIYYTFDEDGVMILEDRSSACAPVDGPTSSFELLDASGALARDALGIYALRRGARVSPGKATVADFNWKAPGQKLISSRAAERDVEIETYDTHAGFREAGEGELLARMRLEAHRARAHFVDGVANVPGFAPGRRFSFGDQGGAMFAGDYFLTGVTHEARDVTSSPGGAEGEAPYRCRFQAIPLSLPYRPALDTKQPAVAGCHTAMVRGPAGEEIHTDTFGRFKAQFHWDREAKGSDEDSRWIRAAQECATSMTLARVGWEVSVGYMHGDPDRPVGFARNINGAMPPAYAQPASMNMMTIKTPSSPATGGFNEIKLDDTAGRMLFYTRAEKDFDARVKNDQTEHVGHDETRHVENDLAHAVGRDQTVTIGHDAKETIGNDRKLAVQANRRKTVLGSETVKVDGDVSLSTAVNETEKVGSARVTIAGGFKMPDLLKDPAGTLKGVAKSYIPDPKAIVTKAETAAVEGAKSAGWKALSDLGDKAMDAAEKPLDSLSLKGAIANPSGALSTLGDAASAGASAAVAAVPGAIAGGLEGAAVGAMKGIKGSIEDSFKALIPSPQALASKLTGGLSDGVTFAKIADQVLTGSIVRTSVKSTRRTVGGAFISAGIGDITTTSARAYAETVGGLKLTATGKGIKEGIDWYLAITVGGSISRSAAGAYAVGADKTTVTVGATLDVASAEQIQITGDTIEVTGSDKLSLSVKGAGLVLEKEQVSVTGSVVMKAGAKFISIGGKQNLAV